MKSQLSTPTGGKPSSGTRRNARQSNSFVLVVLILCVSSSGCEDTSIETADKSELYPLWDDSYETVVGEWPDELYGFSDSQLAVLQKPTRVVVGCIDEYDIELFEHDADWNPAEAFHFHRIFGAVVIDDENVARRLSASIIDAACDNCGTCGEFLPPYGVRVWSSEEAVDFLIVPECGMYILSPTELRFTEASSDELEFLSEMTRAIEVPPSDVQLGSPL